MLPGQYDGFEVCRRLRSDPMTKRVPVVVISALDDAESRARASEAGANAYYTKPFSPIALLKEIERLRAQSTT
jgi:CheY-like chemotaxis protein